MEGNFIEKPRQNKGEVTPQESEIINRYVDLRAGAYTAFTRKEREAFEQELGDLMNMLEKSEGINADFREEMRRQVRAVGEGYLTVKNATEAVEHLKRESHGGVSVPHLYDRAAVLIKMAIEKGVPDRLLRPLEETLTDYIQYVQQSRGT